MRVCSLALIVVAFANVAFAQDRVVVGSKAFTESRILGELLAAYLERRTNLQVERRLNLGGTVIAFAALEAGDIDLYAEYTGTAWAVQLGEERAAPGRFRTFGEVQSQMRTRFDVEWAPPFGFANGYALMVRRDLAETRGLRTISDLAAHEDLRVALSHEFIAREDGYVGLQRRYQLRSAPRGMEHSLAYDALASGEADVVDTYTTDGRLERLDGVLLEDDRAFFPPYDCAPIVRGETWRRHEQLRDALGELAFAIDAAAMRALNARVEAGEVDHARAAKAFVEALLRSRTPANDAPAGDVEAIDGRAADAVDAALSVSIPWKRLAEHALLTALGTGLAALFGLPLGLWMARRKRAARLVLAVAGVLQTVPSLALLALLIALPGFGIGVRSAATALFLYGLLPILRNTYAGIQAVDPLV
ncbi:MAG: glycine betaine ABC transporter substrate-binding protein, partial [Myxococcota bacterium]